MNLKRIILVIVLVLLAFAGLPGGMPKPALACSGSPISFDESYKNSDIFVKANVVEVDDLGQNAIVEVERYYKGGAGAEYIILWRQPVSETIRYSRGNIGGGECGLLLEPLRRGNTVYFMGTRTYAGAYRSSSTWEIQYFVYRNPGDTAPIFKKTQAGIEYQELKESELQKYIRDRIGSIPVAPNLKLPYPRLAPLLITTRDQKQYILPVDTLQLVSYDEIFPRNSIFDSFDPFGRDKRRCVGTNCTAYAPDRTEYFAPMDELENCKSINTVYQAIVYSPSGGFALWDQGKIFFGCKRFALATLNTDKENSADALAIYAQWSPDGRKLAYNDLKGLWLWEEGRKTENPRLIIPFEKVIPVARYFSPLAKYIAVTQGGKHYTLNLETGEGLSDGIFSPTEEYFLAFGETDPKTGAFPVLICKNMRVEFSPASCNDIFKNKNGSEYIRVEPHSPLGSIRQIEWVGEYSLRALTYPRKIDIAPELYWDANRGYVLRDFIVGYPLSSFVYREYFADKQDDGTYKSNSQIISGFEFVYDHANKSLALRQNDTTIFIDDKSYDFSKQLSSTIVQIDWLPSLMYRDRAR